MMIHFIIIAFIFLVIYSISENNKKIAESGVEKSIRDERNIELFRKLNTDMAVRAKLKNVYKTYQDTTQDSHILCLYDDRLTYIDELTTIEQFSIPLESITGIQCDTFERLTVGRLIAVGILAFALKKKDYCVVVSYIDSSTGTEEQLLFKTNKKHDIFVNNVLIARNRFIY